MCSFGKCSSLSGMCRSLFGVLGMQQRQSLQKVLFVYLFQVYVGLFLVNVGLFYVYVGLFSVCLVCSKGKVFKWSQKYTNNIYPTNIYRRFYLCCIQNIPKRDLHIPENDHKITQQYLFSVCLVCSKGKSLQKVLFVYFCGHFQVYVGLFLVCLVCSKGKVFYRCLWGIFWSVLGLCRSFLGYILVSLGMCRSLLGTFWSLLGMCRSCFVKLCAQQR